MNKASGWKAFEDVMVVVLMVALAGIAVALILT